MSSKREIYKQLLPRVADGRDQTITWSTFSTETSAYINNLQDQISAAGISPSQYVTFGIDALISYLADLATKGFSQVDVNISLSYSATKSMDQVDVIFTGHGATTAANSNNTLPYDVGEVYP